MAADLALNASFFWLTLGGFIIGIIAVVVGGALFFSAPLLQWLFPQASFGVVVGNIKLASLVRGIGSTFATRHQIDYGPSIKLAAFAFIGSIIGASVIAELDSRWMFPAVIAATVFVFLAPRFTHLVSPRLFHVLSFAAGFYVGLFGAGIGILLVALWRVRFPDNDQIAYAKIQARFVEMFLTIAAVLTHWWHGNLVAAIFIPLSIGSILGGYTGGWMLRHMGELPGFWQKTILVAGCALAIAVAAYGFFTQTGG